MMFVCYADTWEDHLKTLNDVFKCLRNANLTLNYQSVNLVVLLSHTWERRLGMVKFVLLIPRYKSSLISQFLKLGKSSVDFLE